MELGPEFAHARHDYSLRACEACGVGLTTEAETDNEESGLARTGTSTQKHGGALREAW